LKEWTVACEKVGASLLELNAENDQNHFILSIRAVGLSVLGLKMEWSALMGAKIVIAIYSLSSTSSPTDTTTTSNNTIPLPEIEFVLIKDESTASGSKPPLWIYNKLMNKNGNKNNSSADSSSSSSGSSRSSRETNFFAAFGLQRLTTDDDDDDANLQLVFQCKGNMGMMFQIPVVVRRMFD
jgi:hypothetical protein